MQLPGCCVRGGVSLHGLRDDRWAEEWRRPSEIVIGVVERLEQALPHRRGCRLRSHVEVHKTDLFVGNCSVHISLVRHGMQRSA
jgi:hypothetical protein